MKTLKMILAASAVLAFGTMANAQTTIHITGSTAFRAAAHKSILNALGSGTVYGYSGSSLSSASQAIFTQSNYVTAGNVVIVKTSWSGSVGGLLVLTHNYTVPQASIGVTGGWLVNGTPQTAAGSPNAPATYDSPVTADASFSDSFQSSTIANSPVLTGANGYAGGVVGIIPFVFVASAGAPADLTNVTGFAFQNAVAALGGTTLAQFTGQDADNNISVEIVGRDSDSGTRLETFAETGYGIRTAPQQYEPLISGGTIANIQVWPGQFTDGNSYPAGHEGYSSGGTLAGALNTPGSQTSATNPAVLIGYLGISDATTVTAGKVLTYNGVSYPLNSTNVNNTIYNGQYSLWGYEHVYYRAGYSGTGQTVVNAIAADVHNVSANTTVSGLLVTDPALQVGRGVEGGLITLGNPYL